MPDIPHFDVPFRFQGVIPRAAQVEQDTLEEIKVCVEVIVRSHPGDRLTNPSFGINEPVFTTTGDHIADDIRSAIERWEPRAGIVTEEGWDLDHFIRSLQINVKEEGSSG